MKTMFDGQVQTEKRINLLYDDVARHYHVIVNITGAMAKRYVCKACNKGCSSDVTHKCKQACSNCMSVPPCTISHFRILCDVCNRTFRIRVFFDKHKSISYEEGLYVNKRKIARRAVVCLQIRSIV